MDETEHFDAVVKDMNEKMKAGVFECPGCGCETGFMLTVSCAKCGFIPPEGRA